MAAVGLMGRAVVVVMGLIGGPVEGKGIILNSSIYRKENDNLEALNNKH